MTLSLQLIWNYWSDFHETWYVDRTSYGVMHIGRKFWSPHFCRSYAPWNLENIRKSSKNRSFLCQFFINEITASDAGQDIIRSHLFNFDLLYFKFKQIWGLGVGRKKIMARKMKSFYLRGLKWEITKRILGLVLFPFDFPPKSPFRIFCLCIFTQALEKRLFWTIIDLYKLYITFVYSWLSVQLQCITKTHLIYNHIDFGFFFVHIFLSDIE